MALPYFVVRGLGSFFGAGLSPVAPGTVGSVAAAAVLFGIHGGVGGGDASHWASWGWIAAAIPVVLWIGIALGNQAAKRLGNADPQWFVLDEVLGVMLALVGQYALFPAIDPLWITLVCLVFFRVFDILKPPPVRQLESLPGGVGIMLDDAAAGVMAWACSSLLLLAYGWFLPDAL